MSGVFIIPENDYEKDLFEKVNNPKNGLFRGGLLFSFISMVLFPNAEGEIETIIQAMKDCIDEQTINNFDKLSEDEMKELKDKISKRIEELKKNK